MNKTDKNQGKDKKNFDWLPTTILFFKYSAWIVAPLIAALYIGRWLDEKYKTEPWLFLASVGISFLVSMVGLVMETYRGYRDLEGKNDENVKIKNQNVK